MERNIKEIGCKSQVYKRRKREKNIFGQNESLEKEREKVNCIGQKKEQRKC